MVPLNEEEEAFVVCAVVFVLVSLFACWRHVPSKTELSDFGRWLCKCKVSRKLTYEDQQVLEMKVRASQSFAVCHVLIADFSMVSIVYNVLLGNPRWIPSPAIWAFFLVAGCGIVLSRLPRRHFSSDAALVLWQLLVAWFLSPWCISAENLIMGDCSGMS